MHAIPCCGGAQQPFRTKQFPHTTPESTPSVRNKSKKGSRAGRRAGPRASRRGGAREPTRNCVNPSAQARVQVRVQARVHSCPHALLRRSQRRCPHCCRRRAQSDHQYVFPAAAFSGDSNGRCRCCRRRRRAAAGVATAAASQQLWVRVRGGLVAGARAGGRSVRAVCLGVLAGTSLRACTRTRLASLHA